MLKQLDRSLLAAALPLVLAGAVAVASAGASSYTIVPGGPAVTVTVTESGENADVVFAGTAGQRISLNLSNVTIGPSTCCSTKVSIRKPDGTNLVAPTNVGTAGGFIDVKTLAVSGNYTIFVDPQGTSTGSATLTLYDVPADASGTIVAGGPAVTATTTTPGQNASLTFTGTAGQRVSAKVGPACCSTKVSILKPDGTTLVAPTSFPVAGGFMDTKTLPVSGSYRIFIDPQAAVVGSVTLTLYDVPADASATIVAGGPAVTVTTTTPGQNANLTFDGTAGQRISLKVGPACCSTKVSILKPDGTTLVAPISFPVAGGFMDVKTLPVSGSYRIFVDPQAAVFGNVTVTLYDVPPDASATIVAGGPAVTVTTTTPGQNASLSFSGTADQRVSLRIGPACCSTKVSILKPDGTTLVAPTSFGTGGGFIDARTLPVTGTYTIFVDPQAAVFGSVTVTLNDLPNDVTATIDAGGPAVRVTVTTAGQNARVTFVGTAGQRVSLQMSTVTIGPSTCCSTKVSFLNPDGTTLVAPVNVGTQGGFIDPATLPVAGTYTIFVDPQGTSTGGVTLTLYDVPPDVAATTTPGGAPTAVTTTTPGQVARVTFDGVAGRGVSLRVAWTASICCLVKISILSPDGSTFVAPLSVGATGAFIDARTLPLNGTYTILVDPVGTATGTTTLTLYDVPADVTASISPDNVPVTLTTTSSGQNARFTFTAAAGDAALVTIGPNCCPTTVSILKPDGTAVGAAASFDVAGGTMTARLPVAGGYTILVDLQGESTGSVTARLVIDNAPPQPPVLTITEASPDSYASGTSFYYRPAAIGSTFTVNAVTSDVGTGVQKVTFPGLSLGFTPTTIFSDLTSPYSRTYSWTTNATFNSSTNQVTAYDNAANTASATFAVVRDPTPPVTTDDTAVIGSAWKNTTQIITLSPTDAAAGVAATYYTTNGSTPTNASPQGTLVTLSAEGVYTVKYFSVDNVANAELVQTAGTQIRIDRTNPTSTITFPVNARSYNTAGWNAGCAVTGFCGTATDALSGLQRIEISLRQGSGNYWDGAAFASASEVFLAASGTGSWSLPFAATGFPADGSYTARVRAVDNAGNIETPLSRTFTYDTAPPETTITAMPANPTNQTSANFSFSSSETGSTFQCSLDGAAFTSCTSPRSYTGLAAGAHTFQVRAIDAAGNTDGTPASYSWTIDRTAPETTITAGPLTPTNQTSANFSFSSSESATFQCSLDGAAFASCTSPKNYTGLADGAHTFQVRAIDTAGNTDGSPATYNWTVDTIAPQTTITSGPANPTNVTSASFGFTSSQTGSSFECSLDGGPFAACAIPKTYFGLAEGAHSFQVRATDPAGNTDATPAVHNWTIDVTAPAAPVLTDPLDGSLTASSTVTVAGTAEPGSSVEIFEGATSRGVTAADGTGNWTRVLSGVPDGPHTYTARATDAAGNRSSVSNARTTTVDTTAPQTTISAGPTNPTNQTSASFHFSANESATFQCSIDGAAFAACTSPESYAGLAAGAHSFQVRAIDSAANTDPSPASYSWTIDLTAPETTITAMPANPTNQTSASFNFSASEGATFQCSIDGAAYVACTSPQDYAGLAAGAHSFQVRAIDSAGNTDASPASYNWTIDLTAPETTIGSGPLNPTNQTGASFSFSASESASFQCSIDGGAFAACTSPQGYGSLAEGAHSFEVKATDTAGNTDTTPASYGWVVDTTAPSAPVLTDPADNSTTSSSTVTVAGTAEPGASIEVFDESTSTAATSADGAGSWTTSLSGVADGAHVYTAKATDAAGNTSSPSSAHTVTVDTTAPQTSISSGPADPTVDTSASFVFDSSEGGSSFQCSLDGAAFAACTSPQDYTGLTVGAHSFEVKATDAAGNTDTSPATHAWTVSSGP